MDTFTLANLATLKLRIDVPPGFPIPIADGGELTKSDHVETWTGEIAFPLFELADELSTVWDTVAKAGGMKADLWVALRKFYAEKFPKIPAAALTGHGCELLARKIWGMVDDAKKGEPGNGKPS